MIQMMCPPYHLAWFSVTRNEVYKDDNFIYNLQVTQQCKAEGRSLFSIFILHPFVWCMSKLIFAALLYFPGC